METRVISSVACPEGLRNELEAWFADEFGQAPWEWAAPDHYLRVYSGDALAARLGVVERTVSVADASIRVGGVTGVVTCQQWRGQGAARSLLSAACAFFRTQCTVPFGFLLCRPELRSLYEKSGWRIVPGAVRFAQPTGPAKYPHLAMVLRFGEEDWPIGDVDLQGLPW